MARSLEEVSKFSPFLAHQKFGMIALSPIVYSVLELGLHFALSLLFFFFSSHSFFESLVFLSDGPTDVGVHPPLRRHNAARAPFNTL